MLRDSVGVSCLKLSENRNFISLSLETDHRGKSEATSRHLEGTAPLCVTLTLPFHSWCNPGCSQKVEVLPYPKPPIPSPSLASPQELKGPQVSHLKEITWFILQQCTVSTKQQTHPRDRFRDQRQIRIRSRKASAVPPPSGGQLRPRWWHITVTCAISSHSRKDSRAFRYYINAKTKPETSIDYAFPPQFHCQDCFTSASSTRMTGWQQMLCQSKRLVAQSPW